MERFIFLNSDSDSSPTTISVDDFKTLEEINMSTIELLDISIEMLILYKQNVQRYMDLVHLKYGSIAGAPQGVREILMEMLNEVIEISYKVSDRNLLEILNKNGGIKKWL